MNLYGYNQQNSETMNQDQQINATIDFVKEALKNAEGGHDWFHTLRVYNNALLIAKKRNR